MTLTPQEQDELEQSELAAIQTFYEWYGQHPQVQPDIDAVVRYVAHRCDNTLCQDAMAGIWLEHLNGDTDTDAAAAALKRSVLGRLGAYWADARRAAEQLPDTPHG